MPESWLANYPIIVTDTGRYHGYGDLSDEIDKKDILEEYNEKEYGHIKMFITNPDDYTLDELSTNIQSELENRNKHQLMGVLQKYEADLKTKDFTTSQIKDILLSFSNRYFGSFGW